MHVGKKRKKKFKKKALYLFCYTAILVLNKTFL